jgi:2'-5' RNA ligase
MTRMSSNLVIVAIPAENDYAWRISSEKVPHMTLLFLGDVARAPNPQQIIDFVEHAARTTLLRFSLSVARRGVLGADEADVLFFDNYNRWGMKEISDFRDQLLGDPNIRTAHQSVEQYDVWQPHLTLGYPKTPAKKDDRDYPGFYSVEFDRIAVWTGDYEGPTFDLPWDREMDVLAQMDPVHAVLTHHGIKGMRWGVRRERGKNGRVVGEDAAKARAAADKKKRTGLDSLENHELQALVNRMNLEQSLKRLESQQPKSGSQKAVKVTSDILGNVAKQQTTRLANDVAAKQIESLLMSRK